MTEVRSGLEFEASDPLVGGGITEPFMVGASAACSKNPSKYCVFIHKKNHFCEKIAKNF